MIKKESFGTESCTEKTKLKFIKSEESGELISFISKNLKTGKLKGVRESSEYSKKICVLANSLKGTVEPNVLYDVEVKGMKSGNGYVCVSATPKLFVAEVEGTIISKVVYKVCVAFGNKKIYYDPIDGKSPSSRTINGVLEVLNGRNDIRDKEMVIEDFKKQAESLKRRLLSDGYIVC